MNNNDDGFKESIEYMAPKEMPTGQILTPKAVIKAAEDDLRPYRQLINRRLVQRGCDSRLINIECDLNVEALNHLVDEVQDAGWDAFIDDETLSIN